MEEKWLPILDYAHVTGKSISTLRRHIKAAKVEYKLEDGKYFILFKGLLDDKNELGPKHEGNLKEKLREQEDEITELKMLVRLYEKKLHRTDEPPALPVN